MAEIKIQPKQPSKLPWILGALALIAVAFLIYSSTTDRENPTHLDTAVIDTTEPGTTNRREVPASVKSFVEYVRTNNSAGLPNIEPVRYSSDGLRFLSGAVAALTDRDNISDNNLIKMKDTLNYFADQIEKNAGAEKNSGAIKQALVSASDLMNTLQQKGYPALTNEVSAIKKSAESINSSKMATDQKEQITRFFEQTSTALQAMAGNLEQQSGQQGQTQEPSGRQ